jgi:hypothetical protein
MDSVDEMPRARAWRLPRAATEAARKLRPQLPGKRFAGLKFRRSIASVLTVRIAVVSNQG